MEQDLTKEISASDSEKSEISETDKSDSKIVPAAPKTDEAVSDKTESLIEKAKRLILEGGYGDHLEAVRHPFSSGILKQPAAILAVLMLFSSEYLAVRAVIQKLYRGLLTDLPGIISEGVSVKTAGFGWKIYLGAAATFTILHLMIACYRTYQSSGKCGIREFLLKASWHLPVLTMMNILTAVFAPGFFWISSWLILIRFAIVAGFIFSKEEKTLSADICVFVMYCAVILSEIFSIITTVTEAL